MILKIFSIQDIKAKAFLPPFFLPEQGQATRTFGDCVNDPKHQFGRHPHDYTLFGIGTFDDETGTITVEDKFAIGNGLEFVVEPQQQSIQFNEELPQ